MLVVGGLTFTSISVGFQHSCGVTSGGAAYCWGIGNFGVFGDGSTGFPSDNIAGAYHLSPMPVAVKGGLSFASLIASSSVLNVITGRTGPKVSSRMIVIVWSTPVMTVG